MIIAHEACLQRKIGMINHDINELSNIESLNVFVFEIHSNLNENFFNHLNFYLLQCKL